MRFDAYAGNARNAKPGEMAELLAISLKARTERGRPRGRYSNVFEVCNLPQAGSIWVAADQQLETTYFEVKGETTPAAVSTIRRHWDHGVSRLDSCEDYDEEGAYGKLVRLVDSAADPRVKTHEWKPRGLNAAELGATTYWGSEQSRVMVRVYEAGKMKERLHLGRPYWARAEAQVRPGKAAEKALASSIEPLHVWGFSRWSQRAAELLSHVEVRRIAPDTSAQTFDKTTVYLARMFKRHWLGMLEDHGDWECIGREFKGIWDADEAAAIEREEMERSRRARD